jgi:hypothetical protein
MQSSLKYRAMIVLASCIAFEPLTWSSCGCCGTEPSRYQRQFRPWRCPTARQGVAPDRWHRMRHPGPRMGLSDFRRERAWDHDCGHAVRSSALSLPAGVLGLRSRDHGWSRAPLDGHTGYRPRAQVFMPRYSAPKASNSKLNAAIQAGSRRCDIPTQMEQKHRAGQRRIMDSPAPLDSA